jgi:hypothetical protein
MVGFTAKLTLEGFFVGVTAANVIIKEIFVDETSITVLADVAPVIFVSSKVLF